MSIQSCGSPVLLCDDCGRPREGLRDGYFFGRGVRQVWRCSRCMAWRSDRAKERVLSMIDKWELLDRSDS